MRARTDADSSAPDSRQELGGDARDGGQHEESEDAPKHGRARC